jgi:hypothetical protein
MKHYKGTDDTYRIIAHNDLLIACKLALPWLGRVPEGTIHINECINARVGLIMAIEQAEWVRDEN